MKKFTQSLAVLMLCQLTRASAEESSAPDIGDVAPSWSELSGTDDKKHSMSDLSTFDVVVVVFTCNSCPYSVDYEERLIALKKKYSSPESKVQLIAINSNVIPADNLESMKQRAADRKFNFPYLWDETQQVARDYVAIYTPEFFVLNKERRIVYKGAMDDSTKAASVKQHFVELAITAALAGKMPKVTKTGARGCAIRFKRKRR